jgi:hypothetical protein
MRMRHIAICGPPASNIFPRYLIDGTIFEKESYWTQIVCFDFLYKVRLKQFSFYEDLSELWSKMYVVFL